jgi:hypothetical protein
MGESYRRSFQWPSQGLRIGLFAREPQVAGDLALRICAASETAACETLRPQVLSAIPWGGEAACRSLRGHNCASLAEQIPVLNETGNALILLPADDSDLSEPLLMHQGWQQLHRALAHHRMHCMLVYGRPPGLDRRISHSLRQKPFPEVSWDCFLQTLSCHSQDDSLSHDASTFTACHVEDDSLYYDSSTFTACFVAQDYADSGELDADSGELTISLLENMSAFDWGELWADSPLLSDEWTFRLNGESGCTGQC